MKQHEYKLAVFDWFVFDNLNANIRKKFSKLFLIKCNSNIFLFVVMILRFNSFLNSFYNLGNLID